MLRVYTKNIPLKLLSIAFQAQKNLPSAINAIRRFLENQENLVDRLGKQ